MVFNATFNNISGIFWAVNFIAAGNRNTREKPQFDVFKHCIDGSQLLKYFQSENLFLVVLSRFSCQDV
jgi:hypothetical protein